MSDILKDDNTEYNVKYYAYLDKASGSIDRLFPAANDQVAVRMCKYQAQALAQKDKLLADDLSLVYVLTINHKTLKVVDNEMREVYVMKDYLATLDQPKE